MNKKEKLFEKMQNGRKKSERIAAAIRLGYMGEPRAIDTLVDAIEDKKVSADLRVFFALREIGEPAIPHIKKFLTDASEANRFFISMVLSTMGEKGIDCVMEVLLRKDLEEEMLDQVKEGFVVFNEWSLEKIRNVMAYYEKEFDPEARTKLESILKQMNAQMKKEARITAARFGCLDTEEKRPNGRAENGIDRVLVLRELARPTLPA